MLHPIPLPDIPNNQSRGVPPVKMVIKIELPPPAKRIQLAWQPQTDVLKFTTRKIATSELRKQDVKKMERYMSMSPLCKKLLLIIH